ncbi:MAG: tyrosine-type recombinase/integrase [Methanoregula sp.]|jgi:integrase
MATRATQQTSDPPIAKFLERYRKSTGYIYRCGILEFFDFVNGKRMRGFNCTTDEFQEYEQFATAYLKGKKDRARDFFLFVKDMDEKKVAPKTAHTRYIAVREWFKHHDIVIPEKIRDDAKRMKPKGGKRTDFEFFDKKMIGEILAHGDVRFRAFVLVLASSGIRLGEALNLKWSNLTIPDRLKYPEKPASIFIEESKTGYSRKVFISRETENALDEWRKVIPQYRENAEKKARNLGKISMHNPDAVFPISETVVYEIWSGALNDAGLMKKDDRTGRTRLNIHRLRNFFSVQVASAAGTQVSELLLGHTDRYGGAYTGRSEEQLEQEYRKAETALTISGVVLPSKELDELRRENEKLREDNAKRDLEIDGVKDMLIKLRDNLPRVDLDQWAKFVKENPGLKLEMLPDGTIKMEKK